MKEYIKAMFGEHAVHTAFNLILQDAGEPDRASFVGTTSHRSTMGFGFSKTHCLVLCDAIIRPHLVIESDHLRGVGLAGIVTSSSMCGPDEWLHHGRIIIDNMLHKEKGTK